MSTVGVVGLGCSSPAPREPASTSSNADIIDDERLQALAAPPAIFPAPLSSSWSHDGEASIRLLSWTDSEPRLRSVISIQATAQGAVFDAWWDDWSVTWRVRRAGADILPPNFWESLRAAGVTSLENRALAMTHGEYHSLEVNLGGASSLVRSYGFSRFVRATDGQGWDPVITRLMEVLKSQLAYAEPYSSRGVDSLVAEPWVYAPSARVSDDEARAVLQAPPLDQVSLDARWPYVLDLSGYAHPRIIGVLATLLEDDTPGVSEAARAALARILGPGSLLDERP